MRKQKTKDMTKTKKAAKVLWIIVAVLVVIFIVLAVAVSVGDNSGTGDMTPEEVKTVAGENDLEIARSVWSAQQYTVRFEEEIQAMGTGENSLLDVYSYAGDAASFLLELSDRIDSVDMQGETAEKYQETSGSYVAVVHLIATDIRAFIDENDYSKLEEIQTSMGTLAVLEDQFEADRTAYLKEAGFTDEEIAQRPALDGQGSEE